MSRFAICFFGIPRALNKTAESIKLNIVKPLKRFDPIVLGHFFDQKTIRNTRSGESGSINFEDVSLLPFDSICKEPTDEFLTRDFYNEVKSYGDVFGDDFQSIRNLLHQLKSISTVTRMALNNGAKQVLFVRPDIMYHDSFDKISRLLQQSGSYCYIPNWQHWSRGYNDRFALCIGTDSIEAYGNRYYRLRDYMEECRIPLHPEKFLKYCLSRNKNTTVKFIKLKGSRVRIDGRIMQEDFMDFRLRRIFNKFSKLFKILWNEN